MNPKFNILTPFRPFQPRPSSFHNRQSPSKSSPSISPTCGFCHYQTVSKARPRRDGPWPQQQKQLALRDSTQLPLWRQWPTFLIFIWYSPLLLPEPCLHPPPSSPEHPPFPIPTLRSTAGLCSCLRSVASFDKTQVVVLGYF